MSHIFNFKKNYFYYFFIIFFISGFYFSLNTGITHDEYFELYVSEINKKTFLNSLLGFNYFFDPLEGLGLFYGSGFHYFSAPIEFILNFIITNKYTTQETNKLLFKHPSVFILFTISGIYFRKIIFYITKDINYSNLTTFFYLTYPYLLGHSFFNVKDVPFLSVWLINTFFIIKICDYFYENKKVNYTDFSILAILTAYLLSIRISGVLILIQYGVFFITTLNILNYKVFKFIKSFTKAIFLFLFLLLFFFYLLNPSYWSNPLNFIDAILSMSQHIQTVCTITLGECMKAQNLPSSYIPIWLFFKLPILILFGILLFIVNEKKIFSSNTNKFSLGSIIISSLLIIFLLIFLNINLYDEIRQIMFLIPLILIVSFTGLFYIKRKLSYFLVIFFIIFFIFQNIKIFPYNYLWLNNLTNLMDINKKFELDYWGVSTKNITKILDEKNSELNLCIISNRNNGIKNFSKNKDLCIKPFNELHSNQNRPFYVALLERALKKGTPNNCTIVHQEKVRINFSREDIILAKIFKCD